MDRNSTGPASFRASTVALRKESVDRNLWWGVRKAVGSLSLSARRAWIEILITLPEMLNFTMSLSARRAWIEIQISVSTVVGVLGRSPQGERG